MKNFLTLVFLFLSVSSFSQTKLKLSEVSSHIGDSVIVEGKVTDVRYDIDSGATYLNLGGTNSKNSVTVVILGTDRDKFTVMPETAYKNKSVRVNGRVLGNSESPQIIVHDPVQIILVDKK